MKRELIKLFKSIRNKFYFLINRPRLYYQNPKGLRQYKLKENNLNHYKKNSFFNLDILEFIKEKTKH